MVYGCAGAIDAKPRADARDSPASCRFEVSAAFVGVIGRSMTANSEGLRRRRRFWIIDRVLRYLIMIRLLREVDLDAAVFTYQTSSMFHKILVKFQTY